MKRTMVLLVAAVMFLSLGAQAQAALTVMGTDTLGNQLIYDSALNVTWYDYTHYDSSNLNNDTWTSQMAWASNLTVNVNGRNISGWNLPTTVDGPLVTNTIWNNGNPVTNPVYYNGTAADGYNITSSKLGNLYYATLGNKGDYDTSGNSQSGAGLNNVGPFKHLVLDQYWSSTTHANTPDSAWTFDFAYAKGFQGVDTKDYISQGDGFVGHSAIAMIDGNVLTPTPIPAAGWLLGSGLMGLFGLRKRETV